MAMDLTWLLSAKDNASPVFEKVQQSGKAAADGITGAFNGVMNTFNLLPAAIGGLGAIAGGMAFKGVIDGAVSWNLEAGKLAKTLGSTPEAASIFNVAMHSVGVDSDLAGAAALRLSKTIVTNQGAFDSLGVKVKNSNGTYRDSIDVMMDVNKALLNEKGGFDRNTIAMQIYGRSWGEVQQLTKVTTKVMSEAEETAKRLHLVVGPEGVAQARNYKAAMRELDLVGESLKVQLGSELLPVVVSLAETFGHLAVSGAGLFGSSIKLAKENSDGLILTLGVMSGPSIINGVTSLATSIGGIGSALLNIGPLSAAAQAGLYGLAAAAGYGLGKGIDIGTYKITGFDISGMNKPQEEIAKAQLDLGVSTEKLTAKLKALGYSTWEEFNKAEKAGKVVFDQMSNNWVNKEVLNKNTDEVTKHMQKELEVYKATRDSMSALDKAHGDLRLTRIKGDYDQGLVSTKTYYDTEIKIAGDAAASELKNAKSYLAEEQKLLDYVKANKGGGSDEYLTELAKHKKAVEIVELAVIKLDKTQIEGHNKEAVAIKSRIDEYAKLSITTLDLQGRYIEGEKAKQEMELHSIAYLRLEKEAMEGNAGAVAALAAIKIKQSLDTQGALLKETDEWKKLDITLMDMAGRYVASGKAKQDMEDQSIKMINLEAAAARGDQIAVEALALMQRKRSSDNVADLIKEKDEQRSYNLEIAKLTDELDALNGKDQTLIKDEQDLRSGRDKSIALQDKLTAALVTGNTIAIAGLTEQIRLQDLLNGKKQTDIALEQQIAVLSGKIVGFNGDTPIYAKDATSGQFQYQSASASVNQQVAGASLLPTNSFTNSNAFPSSLNAPFFGGFATGTNYVPADGYAFLHKGESVVPKQYNPAAGGSGGGTSITLQGGINITVQGGDTSDQTLQTIARKLVPVLNDLTSRRRAA